MSRYSDKELNDGNCPATREHVIRYLTVEHELDADILGRLLVGELAAMIDPEELAGVAGDSIAEKLRDGTVPASRDTVVAYLVLDTETTVDQTTAAEMLDRHPELLADGQRDKSFAYSVGEGLLEVEGLDADNDEHDEPLDDKDDDFPSTMAERLDSRDAEDEDD